MVASSKTNCSAEKQEDVTLSLWCNLSYLMQSYWLPMLFIGGLQKTSCSESLMGAGGLQRRECRPSCWVLTESPLFFARSADHVVSVTSHRSKINTITLQGQTLDALIEGTLWPFPPLPPSTPAFSPHRSIHHHRRVLTCALCHSSSPFERRGTLLKGGLGVGGVVKKERGSR